MLSVGRWQSKSFEAKSPCEWTRTCVRALRLIPNFTRYVAGRKEAQILQKLMAADPEDKKHIIRLLRTFEHRGHLCLVTESMR